MPGELTPKDKVEWELLTSPYDWPSTWPAWVLDILKRMDAIEAPSLRWIPLNSRLWVVKIVMRILAAVCPTIVVDDESISGPRFLGRAVGHQLACLELLDKSCEKAVELLEEVDQKLRQKLSPKAYARLMKRGQRYERDIEMLVEDFSQMAEQKKALCEEARRIAGAVDDVNESTEFFTGLREAHEVTLADEKGEIVVGGYRMKLYLLLLAHWRFVEKFQSSVELYHWSCRWLGQQQVGDIYTFQRLCRSYSIRLGARGKRVSKRRMRRRKRMR